MEMLNRIEVCNRSEMGFFTYFKMFYENDDWVIFAMMSLQTQDYNTHYQLLI